MFEVQETRMAMIRGQRSERNRTDDAVRAVPSFKVGCGRVFEAHQILNSTVRLLLTRRKFCDSCLLGDLRWNAILEREQEHGRE